MKYLKMISNAIQNNWPLISSILDGARERIEHMTGLSVELDVAIPVPDNIDEMVHGLINDCCRIWAVKVAFVKDKSRGNNRPEMRKVLCLLIHEKYSAMKWSRIASFFVYNHTTVIYNVNEARERIRQKDSIFMHYYEPVKHLVK